MQNAIAHKSLYQTPHLFIEKVRGKAIRCRLFPQHLRRKKCCSVAQILDFTAYFVSTAEPVISGGSAAAAKPSRQGILDKSLLHRKRRLMIDIFHKPCYTRIVKRVMYITALAFLLAACAGDTVMQAESGVLDLRRMANPRNKVIEITGDWEYYPDVFLDPAQPVEAQMDPAQIMEYNDTSTGWSGRFFGTLRLTVLLPDILLTTQLALANREVNTAAAFFVNRERLYTVGTPGRTPEESIPAFGHHYEAFFTETAEMEILIHISNQELGSGVLQPLLIGSLDVMQQSAQQKRALHFMILGALAIMAVYHLLLFSIRRDYAPLYFSIMCMCIIARILLTETHAYRWFPEYFFVLYRLEQITFYLIVPLFFLYMHALFENEFRMKIVRFFIFMGIFSSLLVAVTPLYFNSIYIIRGYQIMALLAVGYVFRGLFLATRRKRPDIALINMGVVVLVAGLVHDILYYLRILHTMPLAQYSLVVFVLFQAMIMAKRYTRVFFQYEHLNKNLETLVAQKTAELNTTIQALEHASLSDVLTGARNRRYVYEAVFPEAQAMMKRWRYSGQFLGILMFDIDHFKQINDTYGHEAGDRILKQCADILIENTRDDDLVVRWGGEEFLIVLRNLDPEKIGDIAQKLVTATQSNSFTLNADGSMTTKLTGSIGCCRFPFIISEPALLRFADCMNIADIALYKAKQAGRNCFFAANPGPNAVVLKNTSLLDQKEELTEDIIMFIKGLPSAK